MMNEKEINMLLCKLRTGTATDEEMKLALHLIETNPAIAQQWEEIQNTDISDDMLNKANGDTNGANRPKLTEDEIANLLWNLRHGTALDNEMSLILYLIYTHPEVREQWDFLRYTDFTDDSKDMMQYELRGQQLSDFEIEGLLWKLRTDKVTNEERSLIVYLIYTNAAIWKRWAELKHTDFPEDVLEMAKKDDVANAKAATKTAIKSRKRRRNALLSVRILVVVAAAVTAVGTYYYRLNSKRKIEVSSDQIAIQIGDDDVVPLNTRSAERGDTTKWRYAASVLQLRNMAGNAEEWNTITVPKKQQLFIQLPDGSTVKLNSSTRFRSAANFTQHREVYVDGEALFTVSGDAARPFTVHTNDCDVFVLGTVFNVNTYDATSIRASLLSGSIKMQANGKEKMITPWSEGILEGKEITVKPCNMGNIVAWGQGFYVLDSTRLDQLPPVIQRWYDTTMIIEDEALKHFVVSGRLDKDEPLSTFMRNLEVTAGIRWEMRDGELHVHK